MNHVLQNRRHFLRQSAATVLAAGTVSRLAWAAPQVPQPAAATHAIRLGGPVFQAPEDPAALAQAHRALGYRAAYCPAVNLNDADRIRAISEAFARHDVVIAEVGRWVNLLDADPARARRTSRPSPMAWLWRKRLMLAAAWTSPDHSIPMSGMDPTPRIYCASSLMRPSKTRGRSSMP